MSKLSARTWAVILSLVLAVFAGRDVTSWLAEVVNTAAVATLPAS